MSFHVSLARTRGLSPDSNSVTRKGPGRASWDRRDIGDRAQGARFQRHVTRCHEKGRCHLTNAQVWMWAAQAGSSVASAGPQAFPSLTAPSSVCPPGAQNVRHSHTHSGVQGGGLPTRLTLSLRGGTWGAPGLLVARQGCPQSADWGESSWWMIYYWDDLGRESGKNQAKGQLQAVLASARPHGELGAAVAL